ncbi:putative glutaredoxin, Thioredoxin-like superfamily [Helianthus annuus]|uniref:Glutaredoxin, Thioredoxin-like superfamily n=1 Tax=Helianthus annuus TaxID=4232 RepID=A0A251S7H4_HELAN|nr:uncharacterized protein At5g39865 [Helianthus annuus]KAF5763819.1 putative glutaredoxin, Thioredoxin-like superfamily [Helianthus annuus]KAJ0450584.1 putative glutaredoxin, Thioredoxin-like superfamily [Helianthus annuus]KAJ0454783.1 putative glutaredoxin, Thioredoxin-like superfamily [Helianthus annuus]KAJ0472436.1 putative glutaredoxin, Thioredoxin-like superfamily [Helianthus annuus]KAJ0648037.1 putative glutaredoxin, Thioredoxin-like superfamily [Helianthus annuus]
MGCTSSKQSVCRNCHAQHSPVRMSYSSLPNPSPQREHDDHHVVALTSTTLGYLLLDPSKKPSRLSQDLVVPRVRQEPVGGNVLEMNTKDFEVGVIEAKTWSKMIDEKIAKIVPKTPVLTPPGEPEMINAWEMMEGLDDSSPLPVPVPQLTSVELELEKQEQKQKRTHCVSFNYSPNSNTIDQPILPSGSNPDDTSNNINIKSLIKEEHDNAKTSLQTGENDQNVSRSKEKLILYFTSLRGVRKTYEDCCHVRVILKNSGVRVDERDVSMHSGFKEELKELLGDGYNGGGLPKVFVGKKYIGGGDEIRRFHDEYQLDKVLEGCEMVDDCGGNGGVGGGCEACGDIRFLPCDTCSGSCKVYYDVDSDVGEDEEVEESDCGFQRCPDCNENGLIRCPICCD